jgi:hypothetical protein
MAKDKDPLVKWTVASFHHMHVLEKEIQRNKNKNKNIKTTLKQIEVDKPYNYLLYVNCTNKLPYI